MTDWMIDELERILQRARAERRRARSIVRYQETLHRVEGYLVAHPDATANHVYRELGGRRQDVLRACREVAARFPDARNHSLEVAR